MTRGDGPVSVDVLIVGAGPVGLFGAYYAGFRGLRVAVIDSLPVVGGQVNALYPEKVITDIAGLPAIRGRDLIDNLVAQAAPYDPAYLLGEEARSLAEVPDERGPDERPWLIVTTSTRRTIRCKAIIVTGGIGTFTPRPLAAAKSFRGQGVRYFVESLADYTGQDVVIVGGGDSAFDWALALQPLAGSVTLVHRRDVFRAHQATVDAVLRAGVPIVTNAEVSKIYGDDAVDGVEIRDVATNEMSKLPCTRIIAALGFTANLGPLKEWDIEIRANRSIVAYAAMRTTQPGVFAAGDITDYEGKVRLIAVGFGEVATAVNNATVYLNPSERLFPGHSTDARPVAARSA